MSAMLGFHLESERLMWGSLTMAKIPAWYEEKRNRVRERSLIAFVAMGLMAFMALAGTIFAYYFIPNSDLLSSLNEDTNRNQVVHLDFQNSELVIPAKFITRIKSRALRGTQQVDLLFPWPYDPEANVPRPEDISDYTNYIIISLIPRPSGFTEKEKFHKIYATYFAGPPAPAVSNLRHYSFGKDTPYAGINLYLGQLNNAPVFIICAKQRSSLGPRLCERVAHINDRLSARYRFANKQLVDWFKIDITARQIINQMVHFNPDTAVTN